MSIYTLIANMAAKAEEKRVAKAAKKRTPNADKPVTQALFYNVFHSLDGAIAKLFETSGAIIVKKVDDSSETLFENMRSLYVSQQAVSDERLDDAFDKLGKEFSEVMKVYHSYGTDNLARVHDDLQTGAAQHCNMLLHHIKNLEVDSSSRFLETIQHMRDGRIEAMAMAEALVNVMETGFENLNRRVGAIEDAVHTKRRKRDEPTLEWFMDNVEGLMRFAKGFEALLNNDAPAQIATLETIRSIRAFGDYPMSIVKQAVETKLESLAA